MLSVYACVVCILEGFVFCLTKILEVSIIQHSVMHTESGSRKIDDDGDGNDIDDDNDYNGDDDVVNNDSND